MSDWYKIFYNLYFYFFAAFKIFFFLSEGALNDSFAPTLLSLSQGDVYQVSLSPYWCLRTRDFSHFFRVFKISWVPSRQQNAKLVKMRIQNNPWRNRGVWLIGLIFNINWTLVKIGSLCFLQAVKGAKDFSCEQLIVSKVKEWNTSASVWISSFK